MRYRLHHGNEIIWYFANDDEEAVRQASRMIDLNGAERIHFTVDTNDKKRKVFIGTKTYRNRRNTTNGRLNGQPFSIP
ncbi:MAG: hypothetical protein V1838_02060 [Patescibacteria group bacterium]